MSDTFAVKVIASGSRGNSTIIKTGDTAVLVDAGISCKRIVTALRDSGLEPSDLSAVLLTHEHIDHVNGLKVFAKNNAVPIYATEKTWQNYKDRSSIKRELIRVIPRKFTVGNLDIEPFSIPHDAADPVGYMLRCGSEKCTYLTDCGYVTATCQAAVEGAKVLILEANHDVEMLKHGSYPVELQERILGPLGHLSNKAAGFMLAQLQQLPQEIFLAHLSAENNRPDLALATVQELLGQSLTGTDIYVTNQKEAINNEEWSEDNA